MVNKKWFKKFVLILVLICMMFALTACSQKCANGCGRIADSKCMADMCDECCEYWMGFNGCYAEHY